MVDIASCYLDTARRVLALVADLDTASVDDVVQACPGWTVRATVAHLVGLAEDVTSGAIEGYGSGPWTAAQVERGAGRSIGELSARWEAVLEAMAVRLADPGAAGIPRYVPTLSLLDLVVHEHDLRHALGRPGARDSEGAMFVRDFEIRQLNRALTATPLELVLDEGAELVGAPAEADPATGPTPGAVPRVTVATFEFWRACVGRRSRAQVEAWAWSDGPEPWIDRLVPAPPVDGGAAPVGWPAHDIVE